MATKLVIYGRPVPAVRMTRRGAHVKKNAQRYLNYKSIVAWNARSYITQMIEGPVSVEIDVYLNGGVQGDVDNYAKSITDSLNKIAYKDDRQVTKLFVQKIECEKDEERVEVVIEAVS